MFFANYVVENHLQNNITGGNLIHPVYEVYLDFHVNFRKVLKDATVELLQLIKPDCLIKTQLMRHNRFSHSKNGEILF